MSNIRSRSQGRQVHFSHYNSTSSTFARCHYQLSAASRILSMSDDIWLTTAIRRGLEVRTLWVPSIVGLIFGFTMLPWRCCKPPGHRVFTDDASVLCLDAIAIRRCRVCFQHLGDDDWHCHCCSCCQLPSCLLNLIHRIMPTPLNVSRSSADSRNRHTPVYWPTILGYSRIGHGFSPSMGWVGSGRIFRISCGFGWIGSSCADGSNYFKNPEIIFIT